MSILLAMSACDESANADVSADEAVKPSKAPEPTPEPHAVFANDCAQLIARAEDDEVDAAVLPALCAEHAPSAATSRRAAAAQHDPRRAARSPLEAWDLEVAGAARLWRRAPADIEDPAAVEFPDPVDAVVVPVTAEVLGHVDTAAARLITGGLSARARREARMYLARVHIEAIAAIGLDPSRPLPPLARRLAGPALDHALLFLQGHWRQPMRRHARRAQSTELAVLDLCLALSESPPGDLDPLTRDARHRAWHYLRQGSVRDRLEAQLDRVGRSRQGYGSDDRPRPGPESLARPSLEMHRLARAGLVDQLVETAFAVATRVPGPGPAPVEADALRIIDTTPSLDPATRERARRRLTERFDPIRGRGLGVETYQEVAEAPWPTDGELANSVLEGLRAHGVDAMPADQFARRHALARAVVQLEGRPQVLALVLADESCPTALRELYAPSARDDDADAQQRRRYSNPGDD